jgi:hypothetical protein
MSGIGSLSLAVLAYLLLTDLAIGAVVVAVNARIRGSAMHRALLVRLVAALPLVVVASAVAGIGLWLLVAGGAIVSPRWAEPGTVPRLLHVTLGALAVAGVAIAWLGMGLRRRHPEEGDWIIRHGLTWFVLSTTVNLPVGGAWLVKLPHEVLARFQGASTLAMAVFCVGLIAGILALGFGGLAKVSREPRGYLVATTVALGVTLAAMVLMREELRPAFTPPDALRAAAGWTLVAASVVVSGLAARRFLR